MSEKKKFERTANKIIAGVCGGIAKRFGLGAGLVRLLYIIFTIVTGGLALLLYIALWALTPAEGQL